VIKELWHIHGVNGIDEPFTNKHIHKLYHMHAHDARGRENHLLLGTGDINIRERIYLGGKV
jgi:sugar phosphate isomerase/epimerase